MNRINTILIADNNSIYREGIKSVISRLNPAIQIFEATSYAEVVQQMNRGVAIDILMLDLMIPGIEGPDMMKSILEKGLNKVILLSGMENYHAAQRYLKAGAVGFLPKSIAVPVLVQALQLILSGGKYIPFDLSIKPVTSRIGYENRDVTSYIPGRQMDVLKLMSDGYSNREIGKILGISEYTVKFHAGAIYRSLKAHSRTRAVAIAREIGLLR